MSFFTELLARFKKPERITTATTPPASVPSAGEPGHNGATESPAAVEATVSGGHGVTEAHSAPASGSE